MNLLSRLLNPFHHQLELISGGALTLRAFHVASIVIVEDHKLVTKDVQKLLSDEFSTPVYSSSFVNIIWRYLK